MGDRSRFLNINGANYRQIGFTSHIPEDGKVYGIKRNGDLQVADLVEITSSSTGGGGGTSNIDAYTKQEVDTKLGSIYTKEETDSILENIYTKTETDNKLATLDVYTKEEVDSKIVPVDAYTKEEIDAKLATLSSQAQAENPWTLMSNVTLLANTELPAYSSGTYTSLKIDLSSYLPNDENYYEVMLSMRVTSTSSSGNLAVWGCYDFVTPELSETFTTGTQSVQIISSTGTGFSGGLFHWLTGPRRILQIWSSYSVAASIKNLCLSGYKKIPQPVVIYDETT